MWRFLNGVKDPNQTKRGAEEQSAEKKKKQKEYDTKRNRKWLESWRVNKITGERREWLLHDEAKEIISCSFIIIKYSKLLVVLLNKKITR
jgi:hypothetical protein